MSKISIEYTKKVFGRNLKYYRFINKLTQQQLAEKMDCDPTYISDMERGSKSASFSTLTALANIFNIKVAQFFDESILNKKIPNDIRNFYYN